MAKCLYSYAPLNTNTPADENTATAEHIVPYALGGSGAFVIDYCSKKANNDFGRDIDAPFLELPVVGFQRHALGLAGYGGTVPDIRFKGDCVELGKSCDVVFPYQGGPYADFGVTVVGGILIIPADGIQGFQNIVDTHSSTTWTGRWPDRGQFAA